jgi:hypothetical protein
MVLPEEEGILPRHLPSGLIQLHLGGDLVILRHSEVAGVVDRPNRQVIVVPGISDRSKDIGFTEYAIPCHTKRLLHEYMFASRLREHQRSNVFERGVAVGGEMSSRSANKMVTRVVRNAARAVGTNITWRAHISEFAQKAKTQSIANLIVTQADGLFTRDCREPAPSQHPGAFDKPNKMLTNE